MSLLLCMPLDGQIAQTSNGPIALTTNLLSNPGAETGTLDGWTAAGPGTPAVDSGSFNNGINPNTGSFDFLGHDSASDSLAQTVSLLTQGVTAAIIDQGNVSASISFWEQGLNQGTPSDDAFVTLTFLDANGITLGTANSGEVDSHDGTWSNFAQTYPIPVGTRSITYTMNFMRHAGSDLDGYVDDNVLLLTTPATSLPATTTTLTVIPTTQAAGSPVNLSVAVAGSQSSAVPTGTVTFTNVAVTPAATVGTVTLGSAGTGVYGAYFQTGTYSIVANYSGDANFAPSTSTPQPLTITAPPTTTRLSVSSNSIAFGSPETLTATVTSGGNSVPGSVTFSDQNGSLGLADLTGNDSTSTATYSTSSLSVGTHQIIAMYNGSSVGAASASAPQTVVVSGASSPDAVTITLSAGATVAAGTPIRLISQVVDTTTDQTVQNGQVILCNATAPECTPATSLATIQLMARSERPNYFVVTPSIGTHSYKAVFLGTTTRQSATSNTSTYTVTGIHTATTTLAASGTPGAYTLTGTVVGFGSLTSAPTGSLSFNDTSANVTLGTGALGAGTLGFTTVQPTGSPLASGTAPYGVAAADLNGDGFPDIVTENYNAGTVSVFLGNGNGVFQPAVLYAVGSLPERVAIADVNADGNPDLIVANTGSGTISVLINNGDGTFQPQVTYAAASPVGLGTLDLNHDGYPDIVAGDYYANTVSVLINNGDGTFKAAVTYATGSTPQTLAEGDFNGDGNIDLAVGNLGSNNVAVYLGLGDGTFAAPVTYPVGSAPQGVAVGDFNADGREDLAVVNSGSNNVSVLLGNGDGTFQPQITYPVGVDPVGIVVADFNGDGRQDISVGNTAQSALTQSILFGNGDGTFQPQVALKTGNFPYGEAVADFDGDGFPDLAISDFSDSTVTVLLSRVTQTAAATLNNVAVTSSPTGTHNSTASYPGDINFAAGTSPAIPLTPAVTTLLSTTTVLTILPNIQAAGSPVNLSVAVASVGQSTSIPTGTVTFMNVAVSPATVVGTVTLGSAGTGVLSASFPGVGTYSLVASYSGDRGFAASASLPQTLTITTAPTATTLALSASAITAGQNETLTASITGVAGLPQTGSVTFLDGGAILGTVNVTPLTVGSTASFSTRTLAAGTHSITVRYSGDTNYAPSTSPGQTVTVTGSSKGTTTTLAVSSATLTAIQPETLIATILGATTPAETGTVTFADQTGTLGRVAVTPTATGSVATLILPTLSVLTHQLTATYSGDSNYNGSASLPVPVAVTLAPQTITFPAIPSHNVGDPAFALAATASSSLPVTYSVQSGPATLSGSQLTVTGPGTVVVQAAQPGNAQYAAATPVIQSFAVAYLLPTLSGLTPSSGVVGNGNTTITLSGTNFAATDQVLLNGTLIASTYVNPATLRAVIPASFFSTISTGLVSVHDTVSNLATATANFTVTSVPGITFSGPSTAASSQQPTLTFTLANPYPVALTGTISLTFAPGSSSLTDDPSVVFSNGTRTISYTIPANSTTTPTVQLQTGTVSGTATVTLAVSAGGVNISLPNVAPVVITIPPAVPTVTSALPLVRSGNSLTVSFVGFSNTREAKQAIFHFTAVPGGDLATTDVTVDVTQDFATFYNSAASAQYGSSFTFTQPFTLSQDASIIQGVTVTLVNTIGSSAPSTFQ